MIVLDYEKEKRKETETTLELENAVVTYGSCQTWYMPEVSALTITYYYWTALASSTTLFR